MITKKFGMKKLSLIMKNTGAFPLRKNKLIKIIYSKQAKRMFLNHFQ